MRLLPVLSLMLCSLTASAAFAALPTAAETQDLARSKACLNCHQIDRKVIGPAFKDVAQRYRGQKGAEQTKNRIRIGFAINMWHAPFIADYINVFWIYLSVRKAQKSYKK